MTTTTLHELLSTHIAEGSMPGAVALVARGERVEVVSAGTTGLAGSAPMRRDSLFRLASITKPIVAAAAMTLVDDGLIAPADPVAAWLPELASPLVVRTPESPVDDVVSAVRPITLLDLLTFRAGYGFPSDFSLPAVAPLFTELKQGPPQPLAVPAPDAWMARSPVSRCCTSRATAGSTTRAPTSSASSSPGSPTGRCPRTWPSGSSSPSA